MKENQGSSQQDLSCPTEDIFFQKRKSNHQKSFPESSYGPNWREGENQFSTRTQEPK